MTEEKDSLQRQADRSRPRSGHSVLLYLVVLFAAALVLLLMAYFMQQRSNEAAMSSLEETSQYATHSLEQLLEENSVLREQAEELEAQIESLQTQLEGTEADYETLSAQYEQVNNTLFIEKTLYTAEYLYGQEDYTGAAELLLEDHFAEIIREYHENQTDSVPDPLSRYQALASSLLTQGYLSETDVIDILDVTE